MFEQLRAGVRDAAVDAARKSILSVVAGVLFSVGVAFLTVAVWIYVSQESNTLTAAIAIALIYLLTGVIVLLVAWSRDRRVQPMTHPRPGTADSRLYDTPPQGTAAPQPLFAQNQSVLPALIESFFFGMDSAMRSRRGPAPPPPPGPPPPQDRY